MKLEMNGLMPPAGFAIGRSAGWFPRRHRMLPRGLVGDQRPVCAVRRGEQGPSTSFTHMRLRKTKATGMSIPLDVGTVPVRSHQTPSVEHQTSLARDGVNPPSNHIRSPKTNSPAVSLGDQGLVSLTRVQTGVGWARKTLICTSRVASPPRPVFARNLFSLRISVVDLIR